MRALRIRQKIGSLIDLEPINETNTKKVLVTVCESDGGSVKTANICLDLFQMKDIFFFFDDFIRDKKEQLKALEEHMKKKKLSLENIYNDSKECGHLTNEHLLRLTEIGLSINHLLAKDLGASVQELSDIIEFTSLPFILFKKHLAYCQALIDEQVFE